MNRGFTRRSLLAGISAGMLATRAGLAKQRLSKARIAIITDEAGRTQSDAVAFAKQHGLQEVELRTVPDSKKEFAFLSEAELKGYATELAANKLRVSMLKTSLLKFAWPQWAGNDEASVKRCDRRRDDLANALAAARVLGTDKIRIFTGARQKDPAAVLPEIAKAIEELIPAAESARIRLVIENEPTQNVGTSAELASLLGYLPSKAVGLNWDPWNAVSLHEPAWPDGYARLPKARMLNVQVKAEALAGGPGQIRWKSLFETLEKDGYGGDVSLATEVLDGTFDKAGDALGDLLHIVGEVA